MRRLLGVALAVVVAGCAGGERATRDVGASASNPRELVLGLRDLPRGYSYGDDSGCGQAAYLEGEWPKLAPLFAEERPNACVMQLEWVWQGEPPYSRGITSAAYVFRDAAGAGRVFAARDELAVLTASLDVRRREAFDLGEEAELVEGSGLNDPASGVVWRDGRTVAVVVVEPAKGDAARDLAAKQQERLEHPSPPPREELEEDPELQLDDPTLALPVYWLGRRFDPPGRLPPLELGRATVGGSGPGQSIQLWYGGRGVPETVTFDTYEPDVWRQFRRTLLGRLVWDSPCARKKVVQVEGGRAEIFHGYGAPNPVTRPCPRRPPDRVVAHVYYADVVVAVHLPYCYACARPARRRGPYQTVEGTEVLVRSLRVRTPRDERR